MAKEKTHEKTHDQYTCACRCHKAGCVGEVEPCDDCLAAIIASGTATILPGLVEFELKCVRRKLPPGWAAEWGEQNDDRELPPAVVVYPT